MRISNCLRCGSTDIHPGILPINRGLFIDEIMWKSKNPEMVEDESVIAVLCKSCGHIELIASSAMIGTMVQQTCPYCNATYTYRIPAGESRIIVTCQNCSRKLIIRTETANEDIIDQIEEELEGE